MWFYKGFGGKYSTNIYLESVIKRSGEMAREEIEVLGKADIHSDVAELEATQNPGKLKILLGQIGKKIFTQEFTQAEKKKIADAAVKLLDHENRDIVFEAGFVLKEVKEPSSYPRILDKLTETPSTISRESRRVLRAAAENIAMEVTTNLFRMTAGYKEGECNMRAFARMGEHSKMIRELGENPGPKLELVKQKK